MLMHADWQSCSVHCLQWLAKERAQHTLTCSESPELAANAHKVATHVAAQTRSRRVARECSLASTRCIDLRFQTRERSAEGPHSHLCVGPGSPLHKGPQACSLARTARCAPSSACSIRLTSVYAVAGCMGGQMQMPSHASSKGCCAECGLSMGR